MYSSFIACDNAVQHFLTFFCISRQKSKRGLDTIFFVFVKELVRHPVSAHFTKPQFVIKNTRNCRHRNRVPISPFIKNSIHRTLILWLSSTIARIVFSVSSVDTHHLPDRSSSCTSRRPSQNSRHYLHTMLYCHNVSPIHLDQLTVYLYGIVMGSIDIVKYR